MDNVKGRTKTAAVILALVLVSAFILRLLPVLRESVGGDELFTWHVVSQSWGAALQTVENDALTPPLHVVLLKAWRSLVGPSLPALRLLSFFCGLAAVALTIVLGRMVFPEPRVSLLAGALVACNELQIFASFYVRHYSLYTALVLLLLILVWQATKKPDSGRLWLGFAATAVVLVYTHHLGWLFILATLPLVLSTRRVKDFWRWVASCAVAFILFLPWVIVEFPVFKARGPDMNITWMPPANGKSFLEILGMFVGKPFWKGSLFLPVAAGLVLITAAMIGLLRPSGAPPRPQEKRAALLLGGAGLCVPIFLLLVGLPPLKLPYWWPRHLIPAQAPLVLLASCGFFRLVRRSRIAAALGVSALLALQLVPTLDEVLRFKFEPYNRAAAYLLQESPPGVGIYNPWARGTEFLNFHLKPKRHARPLPSEPDLEARLPDSVWVVFRPASKEDSDGVNGLLRRGYEVLRTISFEKRKSDTHGLRVVLLKKPSS